MPPVTCCRTDVICSTEKRFRFTACPPGPWAGLCRETRPQRGPKNPEPLSVQRLLRHHQPNTERLKLLGDAQEVMDRAGEPVELGDHDYVEPASACGLQHGIERGTAFLRARHAVVNVLGRVPATGGDVGTDRQQLVVWCLILCGDPRVDRSAHRVFLLMR